MTLVYIAAAAALTFGLGFYAGARLSNHFALKAVEELRRSLDRHHGRRASGEMVELTGDVTSWRRPNGDDLVFQSKRSAQWN